MRPSYSIYPMKLSFFSQIIQWFRRLFTSPVSPSYALLAAIWDPEKAEWVMAYQKADRRLKIISVKDQEGEVTQSQDITLHLEGRQVVPQRGSRSRFFFSSDGSQIYVAVTEKMGGQYRTSLARPGRGGMRWRVEDSFLSSSEVVETVMRDEKTLWMFALDGGELVVRENYLGRKNDVRELARLPLSPCLLDQAQTGEIELGLVRGAEEGWLVTYVHRQGDHMRSVYAMVVGRDNPGYVLWHDHLALGRTDVAGGSVLIGGDISSEEIVHLWWDGERQAIVQVVMANPLGRTESGEEAPRLHKFEGNPIITPMPGSSWQSLATYNPTAFVDGEEIHILYRAQGDSWESTLGWARSSDGLHIDYRHPEPIYHRRHAEEGAGEAPSEMDFRRFGGRPLLASDGSEGASWGSGGVEDCRVTVMEGRLYNLYAAFNGYRDTCVALSSLDLEDFRQERFDCWAWPMLLTKPARFGGDGTKAGILFPEKIRDQYAIMFRYFPSIHFDFVDDLDFSDEEKVLETKATIGPSSRGWDVFKGNLGSGAPHHWDAYKIGAGGAPVRTDRGWLLIYQGFGLNGDFGRYRAGAMLLDLEDPTRVLARSRLPVLDATEPYELEGLKPTVIYPCGTVVKDGTLFVYYGACDQTTCVATAPVEEFVDQLLRCSHGIEATYRYSLKN